MTASEGNTVFFLTAIFQDSVIAAEVLKEAGISAKPCSNIEEVCKQLDQDSGAFVISDDAIGPKGISALQTALSAQPAWSDIPIILITRKQVAPVHELFSKMGNVSLLEKPFSRLTLTRAVEVALRARRRQYEVRDLLLALQRSKDEAEHANVAKTEFLANMSHEIRTPLGAILGFLDLIKSQDNDPEENLKYMGIIERNSAQLLRLIDDILDLSKVEAGKMSIEWMNFDLTDLLSDINSLMAFRAEEKGIEFHLKVEGSIPDQVCTDPVRLRQILGNIIGNAIKFTSEGKVELCISYRSPHLYFTVKDTGVGISPEQVTKLFRPFSQADTSTTRKFGGTGLGLILSKRLAEALNGELRLLQSQPNVGSEFLIRIQAQPVERAKMVGKESLIYPSYSKGQLKSHPYLVGMKILLVEDSPDNQTLITTYLKKSGAKIKVVADGLQGFETAKKEKFDVILMDIQMPQMDGHEATKKLRKMKYSRPIIALTAHAMVEEQNRCFESGFTDFLTKPVQREHLMNVLSRYAPKNLLDT